jgi:hypothetical protein
VVSVLHLSPQQLVPLLKARGVLPSVVRISIMVEVLANERGLAAAPTHPQRVNQR